MNMNQKVRGLLLALLMATGIASADAINVSYDFNGDDSQAANFSFLGDGVKGWTSDGGVGGSGAITTQCVSAGNYDIQFNQTFDGALHTVIEFDYKGTRNGDSMRWYVGDAYLEHVSGWSTSHLGTGGTWVTPTWNNQDWNHLKFDINNGIVNIYANGSETPCAANFDASALLSGTSVIKLHYANYPNTVTIDNFVATSPVPEPATIALLGLGGLFAMVRRRKF